MKLILSKKLGYSEDWENRWRAWSPSVEISDERKQELEQSRVANTAKGLPPMAGVALARGDVEWLVAQNGGPVLYGEDRRGRVGINLRQALLMETDCSELPLNDCYFQDARLDFANFNGADLRWSFFDRAHMSEATFQDADLFKAQFNESYLRDVDLRGANLGSAWFDDRTYLDGVKFDSAFLSGCHWRSADLTHVEWQAVRRIGEDQAAKRTPIMLRAEAYADATDAYARISYLIRDQGRLADSARFYFRSNIMHRRFLWFNFLREFLRLRLVRATKSLIALIAHIVLEITCGYGEYPTRVLFWAATVIVVFALTYYTFITIPVGGSRTGFDFPAALAFSASSFLGRGYALVLPISSLSEPISILSVTEAGLGTMLEILFVTTFTRRLVRG